MLLVFAAGRIGGLLSGNEESWLAVIGLVCAPAAAWAVRAGLIAYRVVASSAEVNGRRLLGASATGSELVWEMAPDGTLTYLGDQCRALFGREPEDLVGQPVFALLPPAEGERARRLLTESITHGIGWHKETFQSVAANGTLHWIETSGVAHVDDRGHVVGFTATTRPLAPHEVGQLRASEARERVERVLAERSLATVFQPIVDLATGRTVGFEALSRFADEPARSPAEWFSDAELVGRLVELDLLALQTALHAAARHLPADTYVSLNVAPSTVVSQGLVATLDASPLDPGRILLEITEHVSVPDYARLTRAVSAVRNRGVRIAVDDAGAGYASFRHILRLKPDCIKLDQDLVRGIDRDPARRAFAGAVVLFALEVGATVVGEGIETVEELRTAVTLGFDGVQGFYLGRPTASPVLVQADIAASLQGREVG